MAIATSTVILVGSGSADESVTLAAIANNGTGGGTAVDLLGDDNSLGEMQLFAFITSTVTAGSVQFRINPQRRLNGGTPDYAKTAYEIGVAPTNGTQKIPLGRRPCGRYASVDVLNNATGASCSVAVLAEVKKLS